MTENADLFPDPTPALTTLESRLTAYRDAYAEATFRDRRAAALKKHRGDDLQEAIYRLSHYVDKVAQGDPATILAAGYRASQIGRAHVWTPVTNAQIVCRLLLEKKKQQHTHT